MWKVTSVNVLTPAGSPVVVLVGGVVDGLLIGGPGVESVAQCHDILQWEDGPHAWGVKVLLEDDAHHLRGALCGGRVMEAKGLQAQTEGLGNEYGHLRNISQPQVYRMQPSKVYLSLSSLECRSSKVFLHLRLPFGPRVLGGAHVSCSCTLTCGQVWFVQQDNHPRSVK